MSVEPLRDALARAGVELPREWTHGAPSHRMAAEVFDAFATFGRSSARQRFEAAFELVAAPGQRLGRDAMNAGDVVIRRALGEGFAHAWMVAVPERWSATDLRQGRIAPESDAPGQYGHVVDGGGGGYPGAHDVARRITDAGGLVPLDTIVLRPRLSARVPEAVSPPRSGKPGSISITVQGTKQGMLPKAAALGFSYQITSPRDLASGQASGKRQHGAIRLLREWDALSRALYQALVTNEVLSLVLIEFAPSDGGKVLRTIQLSSASVSEVKQLTGKTLDGQNASQLEQVSLTFQGITMNDAPGGSVSDSWSAREAELDDGGLRLLEANESDVAEATTIRSTMLAGAYALELDGVNVGWLSLAEGGGAIGTIVDSPAGADRVVRKHLSGLRYEDISLGFGLGMSSPVYQWIASVLDRKPVAKSGAVVAADAQTRERERLSFMNALISEITFPTLDASAKDAGRIVIKLTPEVTTRTATPGAPLVKIPAEPKAQKAWLRSNFRLQIEGVDTKMINKIEALTIKQKITKDPVGEQRHIQKLPAALDIPNLVVTLPLANAKTWLDWHDDFVVKGNNAPDKEKTGTLQIFGADLKDVLFTLTFRNLGIAALTRSSESGTVARLTAAMYCEEIAFAPA